MSTTCPHCAGTGTALDQHATATAMRAVLADAKVPVAAVAASMRITRSYAYQLLRAERIWTPTLVATWTDAVRSVAAAMPAKRARRAKRLTTPPPPAILGA